MSSEIIPIRTAVFHAEQEKAVFHAEQDKLHHAVDINISTCSAVKGALTSIVSAALISCEDNESTISDDSLEDEVKNQSLESIKYIDTDDDDNTLLANDDYIKEDIPGLTKLLNLLSEGKLVLSKEVLQQMQELSVRVDAASKEANELQGRLRSLDSDVRELDKKLERLQQELERLKQYLKLENLLFHNFPPPQTKNMSSLQFCMYMAEQINYFLPHLPVPVSWEHISDAHPLRTKSKKSSVIIVRFCNRNIRHAIYENRAMLKRRGMGITEHLTPSNLDLLNKAKSLFGFKNVTTEKCNVFVNIDGTMNMVKSINEMNELFESRHAQHVSLPTDLSNNKVSTNTINNQNIKSTRRQTHRVSNKTNPYRNNSNGHNTSNMYYNSQYYQPQRGYSNNFSGRNNHFNQDYYYY